MRVTLWQALRAWWLSRRAFDAVGSAGALLRSSRVQAAAADLPQVNRCASCPSFVQTPGEVCFRCDPSRLAEERRARETRAKRPKVAAFRRAR